MNFQFRHLFVSILAMGLCSVVAQESPRVSVLGESVNLRAAPSLESEVVTQVSKGDILCALGTNGNWVQVAPPTNVDLWAYGELVQDGVVLAPRLVVRSGPGINYTPVGRMDKGQKLQVRGAHGDWMKIAPPSGAGLWISRQFVEDVVPPPKPAPVPEPVVAVAALAPPAVAGTEASATEATVARSPMPLPEKLVGSREQGRWVEIRGEIRRARWVWGRPSRFTIVGREIGVGGAAQEAGFYVWAANSEMEPLLGRTLSIYGREYWVQGVRQPVIVPERYFTRP